MPRLVVVFAVLLWAGPALPQSPVFLGQFNPVLAPAINQDGQMVAFGAMIAPDGTPQSASDAWLWSPGAALRRLTNYAGAALAAGVTEVALSADGAHLAYTTYFTGSGQAEEVHVIDTASGQDRRLASDKQGCVQPLAVACPTIGCYFTCIHQPHVTPDGGVLYAASRMQPFYVAGPDGTVTQLPTYSGVLAAGPQRVISDNGQVVFSSSAPAGPTFAAAPNDVYLMNLDGTNMRNLTHLPNTTVYAQNAVISADGRTIAFESNANVPSGPQQIFAIEADGSGMRQLTSGSGASTPSLSADGMLVAYVESGQISVASTAGTGAAAGLTSLLYSTARDPVLSGDGTQVAFTIGPPSGGRGAIEIVPVAGGGPKPVYAPVSVNSGGVAGVAGTEPPSPGSLISVYGLNFSNDELLFGSAFPLPPSLGGLSLLVNGQPVPLSSVTPWQINALLPQETPVGNTAFQVSVAGVDANTVTAQLQATGAAVFAFSEPGTSYWQAAAFHPGTTIPADVAHPASAGETLETYGSGLGVTSPMVPAGEPSPASPPAVALVTPQVTIGNQPAHVAFAGLVPGLAGVYQINVVVPAGLTTGQQPLVWTFDNRGASIFVQ